MVSALQCIPGAWNVGTQHGAHMRLSGAGAGPAAADDDVNCTAVRCVSLQSVNRLLSNPQQLFRDFSASELLQPGLEYCIFEMETIFTLPLSIFAAIQLLLSLLLLAPRAISLPLSQLVSKNRSGTAAKSVLSTLLVLLLGLFVSSMLELLKGADRVKRGDVRVDLMATVDFLRSQVGLLGKEHGVLRASHVVQSSSPGAVLMR